MLLCFVEKFPLVASSARCWSCWCRIRMVVNDSESDWMGSVIACNERWLLLLQKVKNMQ